MVREGQLRRKLEEDYGPNIAETVIDFYEGQQLPKGKSGYDKVIARLHRIFPEEFLEEEYAYNHLNHSYSAVDVLVNEEETSEIAPEFYTQELEIQDIEGKDFFWDHSVVGGLLAKQNHHAYLNQDHEELNQFVQKLLDEDQNNQNFIEMSWNSPLDMLENKREANQKHGADITVFQPNDTKHRFKQITDINPDLTEEVYRYIDEDLRDIWIEDEAHITNIQGNHGDRRIADETSKRDSILVTRDSDFLEMDVVSITDDIAASVIYTLYIE